MTWCRSGAICSTTRNRSRSPSVLSGVRRRYIGAGVATAMTAAWLLYWKDVGGDERRVPQSGETKTSGAGGEPRIGGSSRGSQEGNAQGTPQTAERAPRPSAGDTGRAGHWADEGRTTAVLSESLTTPWRWPGQCIGAQLHKEKVLYLSKFIESSNLVNGSSEPGKDPVRLWVYPGVSREVVSRVAGAAKEAASIAIYYNKDVTPPNIYIHGSLEELRNHACVAASALSYYDGAIHVAALEELGAMEQCVLHEYAHHLLMELGVRRPTWLHEGFAQRFAGESRGSKPSTKMAVDQATMARPLTTTSTQEELGGFYDQASDMLEFLNQLPSFTGRRGYVSVIDELTQALANGATDAEGLFVWATAERGKNVFEGDPLSFWAHYLEYGGFNAETLEKIEAEQSARRRQQSP